MKIHLYISLLLFLLYNSPGKGQTHEYFFSQADSLFWTGNYKKSKEYYKKAGEQAGKENTILYYAAIQKYTECLVREGAFEAAETALTKAIRECPPHAKASMAGLLNTMGLSKIGQGEYDEAEDVLDKSITLATGENLPKNILSDSYNHLSILYWTTGNNEKALEYALSALELRQSIHGEQSAFTAGSYMNLGLLYQHNNPEKAVQYYDKAIQIYQNTFHPNHPLIASALINKGIVHQNEQNYSSALTQFEKALTIIASSVGKNHLNYAFTLSHIGTVYLRTGETDLAERYQRDALKIFTDNLGQRHPEVAECYNELAAVYLVRKKYKTALTFYQRSLIANSFKFNNTSLSTNPSSDDFIHADLMLTTYLLKAQTLEEKHSKKDLKVKDLKGALSTLHHADTLSENIRRRRTHHKDKVELGKLTNDLYELGVHVCLMLSEITLHKNHYLSQGFIFSEKNKAAVLLEAISEAKAKAFSGLPDSLLLKENELKKHISHSELMLAKAELEDEKNKWRSLLLETNRTYENYIDQLEQGFPSYYHLKYQKSTLTAKELQKQLPGQTALFHYFISDKYNEVYLFCITRRKIRLIKKTKNESLDKNITAWRNSIRYRIGDVYVDIGNILSTQLLPKKIPGVKNLIIIPDGRLSSTPFEALFTQKAREGQELPVLLKKAAVSYNYSASLYLESLKKSKTVCEKGEVLLLAPVSFKGSFSDLPGTEQEVLNLAKSFEAKGFSVQSYLREEANETVLKQESNHLWSYIHLATHGLVNEQDPELSKIIFHPHAEDDGELLSGELYNLTLTSELITLSACQTGLGKITKGEGLIGLSRALLYAGANNLIVSLWNVSDESTVQLMNELYTNILQNTTNLNYAEALQKAKLSMLHHNKLSEPYFWAPFILIGK